MAEDNGLDVDKKMDGASTSKAQEAERSSCLNGSQEEPGKSKGNEKAKTVPFPKLFSFADSTDIILMILGTVGAIGNGAFTPIMTLILGQVINTFGENQTGDIVNTVTKACLKYVYLALGAGTAAMLQTTCWTITGERQAARIRGFYLKTILRQDLTFFDKETNTGEVIGRMSGDTVLIQDAMGEKVGKFLQLIATFIGGFIIAFVKGWLLTLVMMSAIPLLVLAAGIMSTLITKSASRGQRAYAEASTVVEQTISTIRTVASFTGEKRAINSYNKFLLTAYKSGVHEGLAVGMGLGTFMLVVFCTYAMAVWFGGKMILQKLYNGGEVINVIIAVLTASMSLGQTSPCISAFSAGQAVAYKMFETINRKPEIEAYNTNGRTMDDIHGDIELRDVYFNYPVRPEEQILRGFSLSIPSGTTTALVGHSGSGKSTVISLIERFYDPLAGEVLIDGINLKEFPLKWIRGKIGLVSQEPVLFTSCIKDNIAYGKDDATVEEIKAAAELANAAKFIDKLPEGLDTIVGEHGTQLSGGQKQRIAIARAILKDPRILLLDEATSALDVESERTVQEALEKIMVNRTTVMVVHRLTTIRNADIIAFIHQGKIVEKGSHSELLEDPNGAYSQLIRLQDSKQESEKVAGEDYSDSEFTMEAFRLSSQIKSVPKPFSHASSRNSIRLCNNSEFTVEAFRQSSERKSMPRSLSHASSRNSTRHSLSLACGLPIRLDAPDDHLEDLKTFPPREDSPDVSIRRLASLNKPELPILVLGTIAASLSGAILPIYGILISRTIKSFFDQPHVLRKELKLWALMYMTLGIAAFVLYPIRTYLFSVAGSKLIQRLRLICFEKVVNMEISWFDEPEHSSGVIGARLSSDGAAVRALVGDALAQNVQNIATALAGIIIAFTASWQLAFIVLGVVPLIAVNGFVQLKFMKGFSADAKMMMYGEASQVANDAVSSIRTVASFCAEEKVVQLYETKCEGPMKTGVRIGLISGIGFGLSSFFLFSFYAASFYAGARLVQSGHISFEDVFQVLFALTMAATGITNSSNFAPDSTKSKAAAASVFSFIDCKSKIDPSDESGMTLENVKGDIEFRHVSFNYPLRPDIQIFRDINLTIHAGKTVALVGESGSGKSTVIALLQRFYDPDSGTISLDGTEIRRLQLRWLRQQMALVSQEPALFNDTIRANIAYGKAGNASEAEIIAAAELANAHKFLSSLEQGYDTVVGERGVQLSGGQKQRVAIARAIVKIPKILLLDEATSALDVESERVVQDALDRIMAKRTTVVVAHRLSTIRNADLIAVVKNGFITEKGRHVNLINIKDGVYASLVALHTNAKTV